MTLSEQLQRLLVLHLCADSFFADVAIVPDALGYSPDVVRNAVAGMPSPRVEGETEPDPALDFRAWLEWRNRGRKVGGAIVVNFPQPINSTGEQVATSQLLQMTVQYIENPDFSRSTDGLGVPGAQVQEAIMLALNARVLMLASVPRSLNLRTTNPADYESPEEGLIIWNVHLQYLGGPQAKPRVALGGLEVEQVDGAEWRARCTTGTTGSTVCIHAVPQTVAFPHLPTPDNVATTAAVNEWVTLTIEQPVTIVAVGYKDDFSLSHELVATAEPAPVITGLTVPSATGSTMALTFESDIEWALGYEVQAQVAGGDWSELQFNDVFDTNSGTITGLSGDGNPPVGNQRFDIRVRAVGASTWVTAEDQLTGFDGVNISFSYLDGDAYLTVTCDDFEAGGRPGVTVQYSLNYYTGPGPVPSAALVRGQNNTLNVTVSNAAHEGSGSATVFIPD